jgi:NADH:ubiquinone oxidoreductase subunit E
MKTKRMVITMSVEFKMTQDQVDQLMRKIQEHKTKPGPLMPILHDAQHIFGCIPLSIQHIIAKELKESIAKINGVVTFYAHFSIEPRGKHVIGVCLGTACYVRGSQTILDSISKELGIISGQTTTDGLFTLDATRCIGACGLAPVFTVGSEVYGKANSQMALEVVRKILETERK